MAAPDMYHNFSSKVQTYADHQQAYALNDDGIIFKILIYNLIILQFIRCKRGIYECKNDKNKVNEKKRSKLMKTLHNKMPVF